MSKPFLLLLLLNIKQHEYMIYKVTVRKKSHLVCCDLQLNFLSVLSSKGVVFI